MGSGLLRIGLFAEAFGFGPASKVWTVGSACHEKLGAKLVGIGTSVSLEYFAKERCHALVDLDVRGGINLDQIKEVAQQIDVAIVGLQPEWVEALSGIVPIAYIDSLGFMWNSMHFDRYSALRSVDLYLAQDYFGSASSLGLHGIKNLISVGAIVGASASTQYSNRRGSIVHLGGLINIYNPDSGAVYARFTLRLIEGMARDILASREIVQYIEGSDFHWLRADNHGATHEFSVRETIYTSPGLTALLEMAACGANVVPLPPQNYSQALIIKHVSRMYPKESVWGFLNDYYPITDGLDEATAVSAVNELNLRFAKCPAFISQYRNIVGRIGGQPLPDHLRSRPDGAADCVNAISRLVNQFGL